MSIDMRTCRTKHRGFGTWTFCRGALEVAYNGWFNDAASYLAATYGPGHWVVAR